MKKKILKKIAKEYEEKIAKAKNSKQRNKYIGELLGLIIIGIYVCEVHSS